MFSATREPDGLLPSIHASSNIKRLPVKSPVMESIRMSKRMETPSRYDSDEDDVSTHSRMKGMLDILLLKYSPIYAVLFYLLHQSNLFSSLRSYFGFS